LKHWCRALALLLACTAMTPCAFAHKASTSYLHVRAEAQRLDIRWDIAIRDLDTAIGLDANNDGAVTWGELKATRSRLFDYAVSHLRINSGNAACPLTAQDLKVVSHSDGAYAVLLFRADCVGAAQELALDYSLLFEIDALHRGLTVVEFVDDHGRLLTTQSGIFAPDAHALKFSAQQSSVARLFGQYFKAGMFHVWSGLDHMLFLAGLFLPAVLRRSKGRWLAVANLRTAVRDTAIIVTAFTLAHACTLSLAATGAFTLPSRWVESAVALTVLFAGLNNLVPMVYRELFWLSAGFGLIHGAAVASALIDLGLPARGRVWSLLAFNLGVETAQLALLAAVIIPAFLMRNTKFYRYWILIPGSTIVAVVGLCWFIERAFGVYFGVPLP
jgi:HupE / UreJ protein